MDDGRGGSRWAVQRKRKSVLAARNEGGGSDLSSSGESEAEASLKQRRTGSSDEGTDVAEGSDNASGDDDSMGDDSHGEGEEENTLDDEGSDSQNEVDADMEGAALEGNFQMQGQELPVEDDIFVDAEEVLEADDIPEDPNAPGQDDFSDDSRSSSSDSDVEDEEGSDDDEDDEEHEEEASTDSDSDSDDGGAGAGNEAGAHHNQDADAPLYENSRLTKMESIIMILTLAMAFNLSGVCLVKIMELIELHCPVINNCVKTLHNFKKFFREIGRNLLTLHYFCERCFGSVQGKDSVCTTEDCPNDTVKGFFIEVPIINQLQRMFMRPGFLEKLSYRFNRHKKHEENVEDIYDGLLYKEQMENNGILSGRTNISFMWYTDGISIFKSSKFSVWPLFFVINELNFKERTKKENIILAGLWFGKNKPRPNLFLKPFRNFFETFKSVGFQFLTPALNITVKGLLLCGTCDLQAKGIFLRSKLSNGYYGCSKCISAGQRHPAGGTTVHVHPYIAPEQIRLRDNNRVPALARLKMHGYKGLSLLHVFMPSMVRGTGIDIMHQIFLGLSKVLAKLWFDPKFADQPFSCVRMIPIVDERLKSIKPPSFIQRLTRTIADLKLWKAKEFKVWFFYYSSIVMHGVLDNVYLHHHLKLVSAISLLCQDSIFPEQIDAAELLLHEYVQEFQALYGLRFMGMNVHLLLHLPDMVRDLGNLWVYSCFFMEDLNGQIVKLIHGPHQPGLQMCSSASLFLSLRTKIDSLPALSIAKSYCDALYRVGMNYRIAERINEKTMILGRSPFSLDLSDVTKQQVLNFLNVIQGHCQVFFYIRKSGVVYNSERRPPSVKRCSTYLSFSHNNTTVLGKIKDFVRYSNCACPGICQCQPAQYLFVAQLYERIAWHAHDVENVRIAYLTAVAPSQNIVIAPISSIISMCFYLKVGDIEYLGIPVNTLEYE